MAAVAVAGERRFDGEKRDGRGGGERTEEEIEETGEREARRKLRPQKMILTQSHFRLIMKNEEKNHSNNRGNIHYSHDPFPISTCTSSSES